MFIYVYCLISPVPVCIIMVYTFYSSFCVQGAASVAPEAASFQHPTEEATQNSNTGGSSCPLLLVCLMVVWLLCLYYFVYFKGWWTSWVKGFIIWFSGKNINLWYSGVHFDHSLITFACKAGFTVIKLALTLCCELDVWVALNSILVLHRQHPTKPIVEKFDICSNRISEKNFSCDAHVTRDARGASVILWTRLDSDILLYFVVTYPMLVCFSIASVRS